MYKWLLDGKTLGNDSKLTHSFNEPGLYDISLVIADNSSMKDSVSITENIRIYKLPEINISGDKILCEGDNLTLEAHHDLYNKPYGMTYNWESSAGNIISGGSTVTLSAADVKGKSLSISLIDQVYENKVLNTAEYVPQVNSAPVAVATADSLVYSGGANDMVTLYGTSSTDPDGDPLSYNWDLGDGNSAAGSIVNHNYSKPGKYKITLTVSDNKPCDCNSAEDIIFIEVINRK
jgi:PKD repeat protein